MECRGDAPRSNCTERQAPAKRASSAPPLTLVLWRAAQPIEPHTPVDRCGKLAPLGRARSTAARHAERSTVRWGRCPHAPHPYTRHRGVLMPVGIYFSPPSMDEATYNRIREK